MISALLRAFGNLREPALRRVVLLGLGLALACFVVLWVAVGLALGRTTLFTWGPLEWVVDALGAVAVLVLSWLLFPAVVTIVMGFFLERVVASVEALDYPANGPPRHASVGETASTTLRLMSLSILLNLLALPVYLFAPGINFFVFLGLNGYLFGREYFEVVALRRLDPAAARAVRRKFAGRILLGGAVIAGLFAVPLLNLVAPVVAAAMMLHVFEGLRRAAPEFSVA